MRRKGLDKAVIAAAMAGNQNALNELYTHSKSHVFSLAMKFFKNQHDAEDATQDAFIHVISKLHTFKGKSAFSTWLHRVAINTFLMKIRTSREKIFKNSVPIDESALSASDKKITQEAGGDSLQVPISELFHAISRRDGKLESTLDRTVLTRAINALAPGYRRVFILHDIEGYEHHEIARMIGTSIGNSKSQLFKARKQMRKNLMCSRPQRPQLGRRRKDYVRRESIKPLTMVAHA